MEPATALPKACLYLGEWEAVRVQVRAARRKRAEDILSGLQARLRSASSSLNAWLAVLESRKKLEEVCAGAASKAIEELESNWRPLRLDACDGEAAAWLLAAEGTHVSSLLARASRWGAATPATASDLRGKYQALTESLFGIVGAMREWDQAHEFVEQAWGSYHERMQNGAPGTTSTDSWLSELTYREHAHAYSAAQQTAETMLSTGVATLCTLEDERAALWGGFTDAYTRMCSERAECSAPAIPSPELAGLSFGEGLAQDEKLSLEMPDIPSHGITVSHRIPVSILQAPGGLFGRGGGWRDGATLVLTHRGYLHLFFREGAGKNNAEELLLEADLKASVYVPSATRCVFLRRGSDLTLDVGEADAEEAPPEKPSGGGLRNWIGKSAPAEQPVLKRVQARVADAAKFGELEKRCHDFVRQGQKVAASSQAAPSAPDAPDDAS